jgi:cobalt-zinc-cadmium efflux system outer membrane protein
VTPAFLLALALAAAPDPEPPPLPPLDLGALLVETESKNPEILAALARRSSAEALPSQVASLPDPVASVGFMNESLTSWTLGSSMMSNLAFSYSQDVPTREKRRIGGEAARAGIDVAAGSAEATRLRVLSEVKVAYAEIFRLDRTAAILEENRGLLQSILQTTRARYESGEGAIASVLRAQTELLRIDAELEGLRHEREGAGQMLNALLGRTLDEPLGPATLAPAADPNRHASVGGTAIARSPAIRQAEAAARQREAKADLAAEGAKTDFSWSAIYQNRGGLDPIVGGMVGFKLPIFRKARVEGATLEARYDAEAARRDVEAREAASLAEARHWATQAERADAMMRIYSEGILPQARSAVESAASSYATGRTEFVTVIDDFLTILRYEVEYEKLRADRIQALAKLEPLIATNLVFPGIEEPAP